ncbi:MAG: hypothetical protein DCF20_14600 [Pseudanabaena sp.]|nr:MAG: hypothetical protein DCF20_14600 [Pseudanabaena sp.]
MSLLTSSIDLDMIVSPVTQEIPQFQSSQIEHLANLFLQAGGTVKPILLRRVSPISFEILEGYFEYYAALKAQEIDDQFTAIRAYVVPTELESTILEQYNFLRSLASSTSTEITSSPTIKAEQEQDLSQMENAIANRLEQKLSATIDRIVEERLNSSLQVFANQITQQLNSHLLDFKQSLAFVPISQVLAPTQPITSVPEPATEKIAKSKTTKAATTKTKTTSSKSKVKDSSIISNDDPKALQVLHDLNTMNFADLERKLAQLKPRSKRSLAKPIHEQRLQNPAQMFQSIEDVISKVSGINKKTMQDIIDAW